MAPSQLQAAPTHKRKRLSRRLYLAKGTTAHPQCTIPTPCTPPLHSCGPGDVLHVQTAELWKSPLAFSHMKPRGSLAATVLTKGKTLPEGSADLEILHQANRRGILPSGRGVIFQKQTCV